jgi:predicted amidohydrolase
MASGKRGKIAYAKGTRDVIRIGAYQGPAEPGALERNAAAAVKALAEAARMGADFACLPESFLSGYDKPEVLKAASVSVRGTWFRKWLKQCNFGSMVAVVGFTEKSGSNYHNSAAVIQRGRLLGVYRKAFPGGVYEAKTFTFGRRFPVFRAHGVTFGVVICADGGKVEPSRLLGEKGARIIFAPHYNYISMEGTDNHYRRVRSDHAARARENECYFVRANSVTAPLKKMGDFEGFGYGDSYIVGPDGVRIVEAGLFTVGWITADIPKRELKKKVPSKVKTVPKEIRRQIARLYGGAR